MGFPSTHEEFMQAVQNHLKDREGCPIIVIVHTPAGLEMQINFMDYALQMGLIEVARLTTAVAFNRQAQDGFKTGENQMMVAAIKESLDPNKKKVN
jgi:hypothetical protein